MQPLEAFASSMHNIHFYADAYFYTLIIFVILTVQIKKPLSGGFCVTKTSRYNIIHNVTFLILQISFLGHLTCELIYISPNEFFKGLRGLTTNSLHHIILATEDTILMVLCNVKQVVCHVFSKARLLYYNLAPIF